MAKAAFKNNTRFTRKIISHLRKKLGKGYILSIALYGTETGTLHKVYQKYLESFGL